MPSVVRRGLRCSVIGALTCQRSTVTERHFRPRKLCGRGLSMNPEMLEKGRKAGEEREGGGRWSGVNFGANPARSRTRTVSWSARIAMLLYFIVSLEEIAQQLLFR